MDSYSRLFGCATAEASEPDLAFGPALEAKQMIPLFWLAAFDTVDAVTITQTDDTTAQSVARQFIALCTPGHLAVLRLKRRKSAVLGLVPAHFESLYEDWIAFLQSHYPHSILLRVEQLFVWDGDERCRELLLENLSALSPADRGSPIVDQAAFQWFSALDGKYDCDDGQETAQQTAQRFREFLAGCSASSVPTQVWPGLPRTEEIIFAQGVGQPFRINNSTVAIARAPTQRDSIQRGITEGVALFSALAWGAVALIGALIGLVLVWVRYFWVGGIIVLAASLALRSAYRSTKKALAGLRLLPKASPK